MTVFTFLIKKRHLKMFNINNNSNINICILLIILPIIYYLNTSVFKIYLFWKFFLDVEEKPKNPQL